MTRTATIRIYLAEPLLACLILSLIVNFCGAKNCAQFMHSQATNCLSILLYLFAASVAIWAGLFFLAASEFGKWLASRNALEPIQVAFVVTNLIFIGSAVLMVLCAYLNEQHSAVQLIGLFSCFWSTTAIWPMVNNARHILKLQSTFQAQPKQVTPIKPASNG